LANYMINLIHVPFTIDNSLLGSINKIRLGTFLIKTTATEILTDVVNIEVGEIHVPKKYNNSYDFLETETVLYLPFVDSIELKPEYVIGFKISISYHIDLYSGSGTVNIKSSKNKKIIHSSKFIVGRQIPF